MADTRLRAFLYLRVSDARDRETRTHLNVRSVTEQERELRAIGDRENWNIVGVFVDNDRSASRYAKKERGDFADMVKGIEAGRADLVGAWESSRYQRDLDVYVSLRNICWRNNVLYHYSGRTYDMSRTEDRFTTGLDALLAERESSVTRDRILRGVRIRADEGRPHGKLPYGYIREYHPETKAFIRQVEHPEQAAIYREAARRVLAGETIYTICCDYDARGIPTPRPAKNRPEARWHPTTLRKLLTNPTYVGKRTRHHAIVGDAVWNGLIPFADFKRIGDLLDQKGERGRRAREHAIHHLMSGLAECGICGGRMTAQMNRGMPSYICAERWHLARKETAVDEVVEAVVVAWLSRPESAADLARGDTSDADMQAAADELAHLQTRLEAFIDSAADGKISDAALGRIERKLQPQIDAARGRLRAMSSLPTIVHDLAGKPQARALWETLDLHQKRAVIKPLFRVVIHPAGKGGRKFDPRLIEIVPKFSAAG